MDVDKAIPPYIPPVEELQYVNPTQHASFASYIADEGRRELADELERAWGTCFIQDGSVDLTQKDNMFHGVRFVDYQTGELKSAFVSFVPKTTRGADGQLECLKVSLASLFPSNEKFTAENILDEIQKFHSASTSEIDKSAEEMIVDDFDDFD